MDRSVKILLSVIAGLLVVCVCVTGVGIYAVWKAGENMAGSLTDPTQSAAVGQRIADFEAPAGYTQVGMRMFTFDMVFISSEDHISRGMTYMLMQFPTNASLSQEDMRDQMMRQLEMQSSSSMRDAQIIDTFTRTVRGQEVEFIVLEGYNTQDEPVRQMYGFFEGKGGDAIFSASTMALYWDQEHADAFLATFK